MDLTQIENEAINWVNAVGQSIGDNDIVLTPDQLRSLVNHVAVLILEKECKSNK
jgi:hypothetical protein